VTPTLQPAVDVVVPCYNGARYLAEALDSIWSQTVRPGEVIVVDDGSTDDTAAVAQTHRPRVRYVYQANSGIASARNRGVSLSQGEFLAFLDADDLWEPAKLEKQFAALQAATELDAVFAHARQFVSPDVADDPVVQRLRVPTEPMAAYYASTLLIRRPALVRVGLFAAEYSIGEFIDWYARAVDAGLKMRLLPEVLVWRRIHGANSTLRHRPRRAEYARLIKAALDRRRASQPDSEPGP
jgi:glycosyltransferase involved in cell wall biosynthesis